MPDSPNRGYALAGAIAVTTADLLRQVHAAVGRADVDGGAPVRQGRRAQLAAAGRAWSAAAACSAVTARTLIGERDSLHTRVPGLDRPAVAELGVTVLEGEKTSSWRASVRAVDAARAELVAAAAAWREWDTTAARTVQASLSALLRYVEELAEVYDRNEPTDDDEDAEVAVTRLSSRRATSKSTRSKPTRSRQASK